MTCRVKLVCKTHPNVREIKVWRKKHWILEHKLFKFGSFSSQDIYHSITLQTLGSKHKCTHSLQELTSSTIKNCRFWMSATPGHQPFHTVQPDTITRKRLWLWVWYHGQHTSHNLLNHHKPRWEKEATSPPKWPQSHSTSSVICYSSTPHAPKSALASRCCYAKLPQT